MADAYRDGNFVPTLTASSSADGKTPIRVYADPVTHRLLVDSAGGGSGTVTSVSVVSANGFAGTVATSTTTPAITLSTTITGILQGNGTAISAATTTGSGSVVLSNSPTLVTPVLGAATATSISTSLIFPPSDSADAFDITKADGTTKILTVDTTNSRVGLLTTAPTHTLTIGSTGTGFVQYNTSDQITNFERGTLSWVANVLTLKTEFGGTGTARSLILQANISKITLSNNFPGIAFATTNTTSTGSHILFQSSANTLSSGNNTLVEIHPLINQTSTAGYTALLIQPTETGTGSGTKLFISAGTNASPGLFLVSNTGAVTTPSINKITITAPATGSTLTIADGKTLTVSNTLVLAGTDSTTMTFPSTSATIARTDAAQTFTGTQTVSLLNATPQTLTVTTNAATADISHAIQNFTNSSAATMTITLTTTSAPDGQFKEVRIYDFSGVAQSITWVNTENSSITVPATSNGSTTSPLSVLFQFNGVTSKWRCIASV